jgi:hypothetical protein
MTNEEYSQFMVKQVEAIYNVKDVLTPMFGNEYPKASRELSLAQTKLDEAIMWIQKHNREVTGFRP